MILLNDFQRQWHDTGRETLQAVDAVGRSGWYVLGDEVRSFESELASLWGTQYAVGVASGLDALEICLRVLGCKPGDRVITTAVTAFATTLAIIRIGAVPVFVDCDRHGLLDLDSCEATLARRSDIRFIIPVHLYGHSLDLARLRRLSSEYRVSIIEDCAQSILSRDSAGDTAGTAGIMAATSFYPTKNLGALGDGGAILTSDEQFASRARSLRDYGQSAKYRHELIGYNSRLDELQAAILRRVFLPKLKSWTSVRQDVARQYCNGIQHDGIQVPGPPQGSCSSWHLFPVLVSPERKGEFMAYMRKSGIAVGEHYPAAVFDQPVMAGVEHEITDGCINARLLCASEVSLPIHPYLTGAETAAVIEACNRWSA